MKKLRENNVKLVFPLHTAAKLQFEKCIFEKNIFWRENSNYSQIEIIVFLRIEF